MFQDFPQGGGTVRNYRTCTRTRHGGAGALLEIIERVPGLSTGGGALLVIIERVPGLFTGGGGGALI